MSDTWIFLESAMYTYGVPSSVHPIVLQQKAALSEAYKGIQNNIHRDEVINKYRTAVVPSLVALHSLGYSITSFHIDYMLFNVILRYQHLSVIDTLNDYMNICHVFVRSCFYNHLGQGYADPKPMLCGAAHIHNRQNDGSQLQTSVVSISIPHLFYTKIHFVEIIAVGGLTDNGCRSFQSFNFWCQTDYPFVSYKIVNDASAPFLRLCGSHGPFITIMPGNTVLVRSLMLFSDKYVSLKFHYTATDMLVSYW